MLAEEKGYSEIAALLHQADCEVHSFDYIMISMAIVLLCYLLNNILKSNAL